MLVSLLQVVGISTSKYWCPYFKWLVFQLHVVGVTTSSGWCLCLKLLVSLLKVVGVSTSRCLCIYIKMVVSLLQHVDVSTSSCLCMYIKMLVYLFDDAGVSASNYWFVLQNLLVLSWGCWSPVEFGYLVSYKQGCKMRWGFRVLEHTYGFFGISGSGLLKGSHWEADSDKSATDMLSCSIFASALNPAP